MSVRGLDLLRGPTHVHVFFRPPSWRPSYFLLLAQKKVTKEKGTLAAAVCRHPCRQTSRAGSGVRSRHVRVPRSDARASCARPRAEHAAVSSACSPRPRGTREEQSAAVPAAEAKRVAYIRCF